MSLDRQPKTADVENLRVRRLLNAVPEGGSILDVGCVQHEADAAECGSWLHQHLYDLGDEVVGIDYLPDEVAALDAKGYNVVCADAQDFDLGRTFDTIVAGELIEHLDDVGGFLQSAREHMTAESELLITTPNPWAFHRFAQALVNDEVRCNPEHTCWLDERTIRQVFARQDLTVTEIDYVRPTSAGVTQVLYDLGRETIGGTSLLVRARMR